VLVDLRGAGDEGWWVRDGRVAYGDDAASPRITWYDSPARRILP
jgi:hypothetical protein